MIVVVILRSTRRRNRRRGRLASVRAVILTPGYCLLIPGCFHRKCAVRLFAGREAHGVNRPVDALAAVALGPLAPAHLDGSVGGGFLLADPVDQDRGVPLAPPPQL